LFRTTTKVPASQVPLTFVAWRSQRELVLKRRSFENSNAFLLFKLKTLEVLLPLPKLQKNRYFLFLFVLPLSSLLSSLAFSFFFSFLA
jgi:hypothetical protein